MAGLPGDPRELPSGHSPLARERISFPTSHRHHPRLCQGCLSMAGTKLVFGPPMADPRGPAMTGKVCLHGERNSAERPPAARDEGLSLHVAQIFGAVPYRAG